MEFPFHKCPLLDHCTLEFQPGTATSNIIQKLAQSVWFVWRRIIYKGVRLKLIRLADYRLSSEGLGMKDTQGTVWKLGHHLDICIDMNWIRLNWIELDFGPL